MRKLSSRDMQRLIAGTPVEGVLPPSPRELARMGNILKRRVDRAALLTERYSRMVGSRPLDVMLREIHCGEAPEA